MFLNGDEQLHLGASADSRLTALVSDSNGAARFVYLNKRWEPLADGQGQLIANLDVDEPTNWAERDTAERNDREERLNGLQLAQEFCDNATNSYLRRTLQAFIDGERKTINDKIYAPEF